MSAVRGNPVNSQGSTSMRILIIAAMAVGTFVVAMAESSHPAQAVVCARGVFRAGCAGPNGAVVVRRPLLIRP